MMQSKPGLMIWNGLNNPDLEPRETDTVVLGLPFDGATSFRKGAAKAPDQIRKISTHIPPTTEEGRSLENLRVRDLGNLSPAGLNQVDYFDLIKKRAAELFEVTFPTFIGGDHSVTIPLLNAAAAIWGDGLGIIHLDAHLDLCAELGGNLLSHGCTHRRVLEKNNLPLGQVWFIGIRSFELQELQFLKGLTANIITAAEICRQGIDQVAERALTGLKSCRAIYLTIDIDFLDPAFAPGTGTPKPGGFSTRDLLCLLRHFTSLPLIGMDLVEVSPPLDHNDITSFAAQRIITETWGLFLPKPYKIKAT
jgi:agmatinase